MQSFSALPLSWRVCLINTVVFVVAAIVLVVSPATASAEVLVSKMLRDRCHAVELRVADSGRGLGGREEGSGIRGMRKRALLVDGQLSIGSSSGGGTEVRLVVPVGTNAAGLELGAS